MKSFISYSLLVIIISFPAYAQTYYGASGIISIPDAYTIENGKLLFGGYYFVDDFEKMNSIPQFSPFLVMGLNSVLEAGIRMTACFYEDKIIYKPRNFGVDRLFTAKFVLIKESLSSYLPQITVGCQDMTGTRIFNSSYIVLGKKIELNRTASLILTAGWGSKLTDMFFGEKAKGYCFIGPFGGFHLKLWDYFSLMAEYDSEILNFGLNTTYNDLLHFNFFIIKYKYFGGGLSIKL